MKFVWMAAVLVMSGGLCLAQSEPPSLADIARQNQAARHQGKSRIVLTDDDFSSGKTEPLLKKGAGLRSNAGVTGVDSGKPDAAKASDSGPQTENPQTEKKTEQKKEDKGQSTTRPPSAQDEVERLKKELEGFKAQQEGWRRSAGKYEEQLAAETSEFRRSMYQDALDNNRQNMVFFQRKIDETESKLASAEEAAAKADTSSQTVAGSGPPH
ncbi:MAG TPA: hypothetical protein VNW97_01660 [Candidatus Saccharimonadales bacterium]|jgi:hypothetical protein|nr:hypothetical protein [Candidatus Saccharimonadales bacterium]